MSTFALVFALALAVQPQEVVFAPPYVQLGESYRPGSITIMWHTKHGSRADVEVSPAVPISQSATAVVLGKSGRHYVHRAVVTGLRSGAKVDYFIRYVGVKTYSGSFVAPKDEKQSFSFIAVGDIGRGTSGQKKLAVQMFAQKVDQITLLGDIAYPYGRISDYREFFWPIQNSDAASPKVGAPLLRNVVTIPVTGNHDNSYRSLTRFPDGLAYYAYWAAPVNGPALPLRVKGPIGAIKALDAAAKGNLKRIGNYSFSYGNSRWVVIDSSSHVNWRDPALRTWLAGELAKSRQAGWSFVAMHAPPYHSSRKHAEDTGMRVIAELISSNKVDVLFAGHIHNYQRSFPLKTERGKVVMDRRFDGKKITHADGTIHIISGGGGAELYNREQSDNPRTWQPFTAAMKTVHSFTRVDVKGSELILRQIDTEGRIIDQIRLTK